MMIWETETHGGVEEETHEECSEDRHDSCSSGSALLFDQLDDDVQHSNDVQISVI